MTISSEVRKAGPFNGNDLTTSFPFAFKVFDKGDLRVVRTMPSGIEADLVLGSDYSVTLNPDQDATPGGTIAFPISGAPLAKGWKLTVVGDIDSLQPTDLTNQGGFYPQVIENAFDRLTMLVQQIEEELGRAIRVAVSDDPDDLALPAVGTRADKVLGFGTDGNFRLYDTNVSVVATLYRKFTPTAGQTKFTLPQAYTPGGNALYVFRNGSKLVSGTDFTETSSTTFDLLVGASGTDVIEAFAGVPQADLPSTDAALVRYTPAGTGAVATDVAEKLREFVSVKDFGALGDGVSNDAAAIQTALNWVIANDKALYFPEGVYLISGGDAGLTNSRIEPTIGDGDSVVMFGAGPGKTIIKEKSGDTLAYGAFHMMLYFNVGASETVNNLIIRDMTFDKNGASNGAPPSTYTWEQSHIIGAATNLASGRIRYALFENIEMLDKVGGGIVLMQGNVDNAVIRNCHARNFSNLFGERGDFEFQAHVQKLDVQSCTGRYAQCEPDTAWPGISFVAAFRDCTIDALEFTSYGDSADAVKAQTVIVDNCVATSKLTARNIKLLAKNSTFVVGNGANEFWSRTAPGSSVVDCKVVTQYDSGANTHKSFYPRGEATLGGTYVDFVRCVIEPQTGASGTTTGSAIDNAAVYSGDQPFSVRFIDCAFSAFYERTLNAYANGIYEFIRCKIAGWSTNSAIGAINVGGFSTYFGKVLLQDCDFSRATATIKVYYNNSNALWELRWRGAHKYSEFAITWAAANPDLYTKFDGIFVADATPEALGIKGMRVRVSNPVEGAGEEYVCLTNAAAGSATWRITKQFGVKKNTTANRPTLKAADIGAIHLDTTLDADGKPIWWTGTAWVDATGLVV